MKKYEYNIFELKHDHLNVAKEVQFMDEIGLDGWHIFKVIHNQVNYINSVNRENQPSNISFYYAARLRV